MLEKLEVNKALGPDGVLNWNLRECTKQLVDKIQKLITKSLVVGEIPDYKRVYIVPIYKRETEEEPMNYRSVSLTCGDKIM